jgi:hypothetical protein
VFILKVVKPFVLIQICFDTDLEVLILQGLGGLECFDEPGFGGERSIAPPGARKSGSNDNNMRLLRKMAESSRTAIGDLLDDVACDAGAAAVPGHVIDFPPIHRGHRERRTERQNAGCDFEEV